MNDQQLELRLRAWYAVEIDEHVVAPPALRASVLGIPTATRPDRRADRRWLLLAAALVIVAIASAVAVGAGIIRLPVDEPSDVTPTLGPSPVPVPSTSDPSLPNDGVTVVQTTTAFSFAGADTPADLGALVSGPDGAPYVLDRATRAVYRIDVAAGEATPVLRAGQVADGATVDEPHLLAVAGPDVLVLDRQNALWRWRPSGDQGDGTVTRLELNGAEALGDDLSAMATFCRDAPECSLNNLYFVDPSDQMIWQYQPAANGSGYPATTNAWLRAPRDVSDVTGMFLDGDLFLVDGGRIVRFTSGAETDWQAEPPREGPAGEPAYRLITSPSGRQEGLLYAFPAANDAVVAVDKADGRYIGQYRSAGEPSFADMRGMYVQPGLAVGPTTLWWIDQTGLHRSILEEPATRPAVSPSPASSSSPAPSALAPRPTGEPVTRQVASMTVGRALHTATLLQDGRVLIVGGMTPDVTALRSAEMWDPKTERFTPTGSLITARYGHTATRLLDGRVAIVGGVDPRQATDENAEPGIRSIEIWDPATESFRPAGETIEGRRAGHSATLLSDGRVLIVGGADDCETRQPGADQTCRRRTEIWDPASESSVETGPIAEDRAFHAAVRLSDGRVFIVGSGGAPTIGAETWDPLTGRWSRAGELRRDRSNPTATLLADGTVLVTGGSLVELESTDYRVTGSTEIWDPARNQFAASDSMAQPRTSHHAIGLPDGRVLLVGGVGQRTPEFSDLAVAELELFDPATGTFAPAGQFAAGHSAHTATLLADGRVLVTGGWARLDHQSTGRDIIAAFTGDFAAAELWGYE